MTDLLREDQTGQDTELDSSDALTYMLKTIDKFRETATDTNGLTFVAHVLQPDWQRITEDPTVRLMLEQIEAVPEGASPYFEILIDELHPRDDGVIIHERIIAVGELASGEEFRMTSTVCIHPGGCSADEIIHLKPGKLKDDENKLTYYLEYLQRNYGRLSS